MEQLPRRAESGLSEDAADGDPDTRGPASGAGGQPARSFAHVPELTGLRGVAIGMVILDHTLNSRFPGGFIGVDIFFVLSGYLITTLLIREFRQWGNVKVTHFYGRRLLRLGPALSIMLSVYLVVALVAADDAGEHTVAAFTAATYMMDWSQALNYGSDGYLIHTWSLGVEEQFYLLWPVILIVALRFRVSVWKIIVGLIAAVSVWRGYLVLQSGNSDPQRTYLSFDTRVDTLLVGCLLAVVPIEWGRRVGARLPIVPLALLAMLTLVVQWRSTSLHLAGFTLIAAAAGWLTLGAMNGNHDGIVRRLLRWGPVEYLGRISYGVYLWHLPIALALATQLPSGSRGVFPLTCVLSFGIAAASYHWVERPILNRWRFARPATPSPEADVAGWHVVRRFGTPASP